MRYHIYSAHMNQQACVSHHQQVVACGETHMVRIPYTLGDPPLQFACWRGMNDHHQIMEGMMIMNDISYDLALQIFRNNPRCNWEISNFYGSRQQPEQLQAAACFISSAL